MAVFGRLIEEIELAERLRPILGERAVADLESVDAAAAHEEQLVAQHIARGAQLAAETQPAAQQPRLRIGPPVGEAGKGQVTRSKRARSSASASGDASLGSRKPSRPGRRDSASRSVVQRGSDTVAACPSGSDSASSRWRQGSSTNAPVLKQRHRAPP